MTTNAGERLLMADGTDARLDREPVPLTEAQEGLWYAQRIDPQNPIFNTAQCLDLRGSIDTAAWRNAVTVALADADGLAMRFVDTDDGPRHVLDEAHRAAPEVIDMRVHADAEGEAQRAIERDLTTPLDPTVDRLVAQRLYVMADDHARWYQRAHHLVIDGYGTMLLTRRICELYASQVRGDAADDRAFGPYAAVLAEDRVYRTSARRAADAAFWHDQFADTEATTLGAGTAVTSHTALRHALHVPEGLSAALRNLAGSTPWPDVVVALIAEYLARHLGVDDVVVGVPTMERLDSAAARVPAMVMNVLPVRVRTSEDLPIGEHVRRVAAQLRECRRHGRYRGEQIRRDLGLPGQQRLHGALINVLPFERLPEIPGVRVSRTTLGTGPVDDLTITWRADSAAGQTVVELEANPALYTDRQVRQHARRLNAFLTSAVRADRLADVPTVTPAEQVRWTTAVNDTAHALRRTTLTALIETSFQRTPAATAIVSTEGTLTYGELAGRTAALRDRLFAADVRGGDIVAVALPRSADLIVSLVATLRAGAAYLPLDVTDPPERLRTMIRFARPKVVLTHAASVDRIGDLAPVLLLPEAGRVAPAVASAAAPDAPSPEDAAYVIYTSGSTGEPKGVVIEHRAIVNRLEWMRAHYGITSDDRILQKTPATFDVSVWEFFLPLMAGATLVVAPPDAHKDPAWIARLIREHAITTLHFVPSMLALFVSESSARGLRLRRVFCSGEALPAALRDRFHDVIDAELHNLYGPTEAAVDVTYWDASKGDRSAPVPIGHPVWNTRMYVLDRRLRVVPPGTGGDLYIAGVQLAREYLGRPDLTNDRFVPDPFVPGERMYRTGDIAQRRDDGALIFLGRSDQQVKVRGVRIELGEIEAALEASPGVAHAAVVTQLGAADDRRLVAYVVPTAGSSLDVATLREQMRQRLPDQWLPSAFVILNALPLTRSGKLNRAALPEPDPTSTSSRGRAPQSATERRLAALFADVLTTDETRGFGVDDDFFLCGGHSLLAARLMALVRQEWSCDLGLGVLFANPTIATLAARIDATRAAMRDGHDVASGDGFRPLLLLVDGCDDTPPVFCVHPAGGLSWCYGGLARAIAPPRRVYGIQAPALDSRVPLPDRLEDLAAHYVDLMRTVQRTGPYHLVGWSIGGILAHAMAVALQANGAPVGTLALLDAYPSDRWRAQPDPGEGAALRALLLIAGHAPDAIAEPLTRERVIAHLRRTGHPLGELSNQMLTGMIRLVAHNNRLVRAFAHGRYRGTLLYFRAAFDHRDDGLDPGQWQPYVEGPIEVHDIPALHAHLTGPGAVSAIAPVLGAWLNRRP